MVPQVTRWSTYKRWYFKLTRWPWRARSGFVRGYWVSGASLFLLGWRVDFGWTRHMKRD